MPVRPKGRCWQADVREGTKRHRPQFKHKPDAEAWEAAAKVAVAHGRPVPNPLSFCSESSHKGTQATAEARPESKGGQTLKAALEATRGRYWSAAHTSHGDKVALVIADVLRHFGDTYPVADVDEEAIDGYIEALSDRGNARTTINKKLNVLSKTLRHAESRGKIDRMPKVERLSAEGQRTRFLTEHEESEFLRLFGEWDKPDAADVFVTMLDTGMRNSEVWSLHGSDVWFKQNKVHIWRTKTDRPRSLPMTRRVRRIIELREIKYGKGLLFPELDNFSYGRVFNRARNALGMEGDPDVVPYVARHTFASRLVQRGVHLRDVMEAMGHTNINQTMRYAQMAPDSLERAFSVLEQEDAAE